MKRTKKFRWVQNYCEVVRLALAGWTTSCRHSFNTTFVGTSQDLEVSFVTPVGAPLVQAQPIRNAVFHSPSQDFHGVAAEQRNIVSCLVDTGLVLQEVGEHPIHNLHWTVLHQLDLHSRYNTAVNWHHWVGLVSVVVLHGNGFVDALGWAFLHYLWSAEWVACVLNGTSILEESPSEID